jgi:hypothetical protein
VQYRVLRLFRRAGIDSERQRGALVHGLRHTFATDLANTNVSVYELKNLLGHESIATSQRYMKEQDKKPAPPQPATRSTTACGKTNWDVRVVLLFAILSFEFLDSRHVNTGIGRARAKTAF